MIILIGTKGQLVKMAPVMKELQNRGIPYKYVHTNQHPQLCRILEKKFGLKEPDLHLWTSKKDLEAPYEVLIWAITCFLNVLRNKNFFKGEKLMVTHGDTMSTLFACIIGKMFGMKVAHIEAGLRSFSILHPFPEELVRRLSSKFSDLLFAPSNWAVRNLRRERGKIINTLQNTVFDTLWRFVGEAQRDKSKGYVVAAIHRQETIYNKERFKKAVGVVENVAKERKVIYILHKTSEYQLKKFGLYDKLKRSTNIELRGYMDYISFMQLVRDSEFVITDGGGLQEETYFLNVPCLLLRNRTERMVGLGETALLSEFKEEKINYFLQNYKKFQRKDKFIWKNPSKIIVDELLKYDK